MIKQFWLESGGGYGCRKIFAYTVEHGESIGINRVHKLMQHPGLKAQVACSKPRHKVGIENVVVSNQLNREFDEPKSNHAGTPDITNLRVHEGWLYLVVVVGLFSKRVVVWSMQSRITKDLVLDALLMAVWKRNPEQKVMVHSYQGSQYTSHDWSHFLKFHGLEANMSRRGNRHDNAVAESLFQLLKRERIKRKI